jgi:peptide/nickel transport system substrate-binding protein
VTRRSRAAACLSLLSLLLAACGATIERGSVLRYGLTLAPSGIDPHLNASSELTIPLGSVYDTLIFQDPAGGAFVPGLARSWTISDDGLVYTFSLRDDVVFHDGTPFNAEAVRANLDYITDPDHHSQKALYLLGPLERVEVLDESTVALHLRQPYAPLLDALSQVYLGMASPKALDAWGPQDYGFHQVGTGPYTFVEYVPNDHLTLRANPAYAWAPSIYRNLRPAIETIEFRFYEDAATRALALESGEIDVIGEVPARDAARLVDGGGFTLRPVPIPGQPTQFLFNTRLTPTDDLRVRQALLLAVDRPAITLAVYGKESPPANGPVSATTAGYAPSFASFAYDPDAAAALLDEAGWTRDDPSALRLRDGQPLRLRIVSPTWGSNPEAAQLIAAAWRALGAQVDLDVAPGFGPLKEAQAAGAYHAIGVNFFGHDPDLLRAFYRSDGLYNWANLADPELDSLLDQGAAFVGTEAERDAVYDRIAGRLAEEAVLLPIRDYVNLVVARDTVDGLAFSSQGWNPFLVDLRLRP